MRAVDDRRHPVVCAVDDNTSAVPFRRPNIKAVDASGLDRLARNVESLGYSTLTMPDHFDDQSAPVPALMAAAAVTETLRVGALVWDNDYKHPVVLAKELATIDVLSGGRLEIGLGAGWLATDYQRSGIPYDSNKVRVDRFEEGLAVIKAAISWRGILVRRFALLHQQLHGHAAAGAVAWPAHPGGRWR